MIDWFDHQKEAFEGWAQQVRKAACLYFKTGAGKTWTSLEMMRAEGVSRALVVAPPSTHPEWAAAAVKFGMKVDTISHAKFRRPDYKLSRFMPIVVDEFHMMGGHTGKGFDKLRALARRIEAPLIICSATPNYNDADRVYCVSSVLDPVGTKGGYLDFLYKHCNVVPSPFKQTPDLDEDQPFRNFKDAAEFLSSLPGVYYLPDDLVWSIDDVPYHTIVSPWIDELSYNARDHRMIASGMEREHTRINQQLIQSDDLIHPEVMFELEELLKLHEGEPVLIFANHATVALALAGTLHQSRHKSFGLVTGGMTSKAKAEEIRRFKAGKFPILIGTASLATGTDGMDKMCDTLIILDDTNDDSLRRQLVGRIMPRGADTDTSKKRVYRLLSS